MLTSTSFAAALRDAHFELKRLAAELETAMKSVVSREVIGPVWHYGQEQEPMTVRYGDGQLLNLADGRVILLSLDLVLEPGCVMAHAGISASNLPNDSHPDEPEDVDPDIVAELGPREARSDSDAATMIRELVADLLTYREEIVAKSRRG